MKKLSRDLRAGSDESAQSHKSESQSRKIRQPSKKQSVGNDRREKDQK
jgi:hypothetical protein